MAKKNKANRLRFFNARLTSTISITLVLVLLGITTLLFFVGNGFSKYIKENMSFNVMLKQDITDAQIVDIRKKIDKMPFVKSSQFISKEEAKKQLVQDLGEDPEELLGYNPAQDFIEINLKSAYANRDSLQLVEKSLNTETNVQDLVYQQESIDLVNNNLSKITTVLLILSGILLFISFALIRNTIRLSIYAKRFIINTMKLVGATGGFIRRPFILRNIWMGLVAGILANILIVFILYYFNTEYANLQSVLSLHDLVIVFSVVILLGVLITMVATYFAVNRYLRMKTENIYYI